MSNAATATIYATGGTGVSNYKTGYVWNYYGIGWYYTYPNTIEVGDYDYWRGWAVFDLSTIPAGSIITSYTIGYNVTAYWSVTGTCKTYGYAGDVSTSAFSGSGTTVWTDMTSGTLISTQNYGTSTGNHTLPSTAAGDTFLTHEIGTKVTISFTVPSTSSYGYYYFTGWSGTAATTGAHRPYLMVTYCKGVEGLSATATPGTLCAGGTINLTGNVTGDTALRWVGPGGYSSTNINDSVVGATTSATGVYSFIVTDSFGCNDTATTTPISVNPLPAAISGIISPICSFSDDTLTEPETGHWTLFPPGIGTLHTMTHTDSASFKGTTYYTDTATVTFTSNATGCQISSRIPVKPFPAPITGAPSNDTLCFGSTFIARDTSYGDTGTWVSAVPGFASITSSGLVTALSPGTTIISYTNPANHCGPQKLTLTVAAIPSQITGQHHVCITDIDSLTDSVSGGIWTSSYPFIGTVATETGWLTGYNPGSCIITYTMPGNCFKTFPVTVIGGPGPLLNVHPACPGDTFAIQDSTQLGIWSNSNPAVATVTGFDSASATVNALTAGTTIITYTSCGQQMTATLVVNSIPTAIMGKNNVCIGDTVMMTDSTEMGIWRSKYDSIATAAAAFGIITGVAPGTDSIYYQLANGCKTRMAFTVNPLPAAIGATSNVICANSYTVLNDATGSGTWHSKDSLIAKFNKIGVLDTLFGESAGYDTVSYSSAYGCKVYTVVTVNPLPAPIVALDSTMCSEDSMQLSDITPGGYWSTSTPSVFKIDSLNGMLVSLDTMKDSGFASYTLYSTGCSSNYFMRVREAPHPVISYNGGIGEGYVVNNGAYVSYQWYDATTIGAIPGAVTNYLALLYNQEYYVIVIDTFGCWGRSASYNESTAGVHNVNKANSILIYPNPAKNNLFVESPIAVDAVIFSTEGKKIADIRDVQNIDLAKYASGMYWITFIGKDGSILGTQKFEKE